MVSNSSFRRTLGLMAAFGFASITTLGGGCSPDAPSRIGVVRLPLSYAGATVGLLRAHLTTAAYEDSGSVYCWEPGSSVYDGATMLEYLNRHGFVRGENQQLDTRLSVLDLPGSIGVLTPNLGTGRYTIIPNPSTSEPFVTLGQTFTLFGPKGELGSGECPNGEKKVYCEFETGGHKPTDIKRGCGCSGQCGYYCPPCPAGDPCAACDYPVSDGPVERATDLCSGDARPFVDPTPIEELTPGSSI